MKKMDKFEILLNDKLTEGSYAADNGWAMTTLMGADLVLYDACKSRRRWKRACLVLAGLLALTLGGLIYAVLL